MNSVASKKSKNCYRSRQSENVLLCEYSGSDSLKQFRPSLKKFRYIEMCFDKSLNVYTTSGRSRQDRTELTRQVCASLQILYIGFHNLFTSHPPNVFPPHLNCITDLSPQPYIYLRTHENYVSALCRRTDPILQVRLRSLPIEISL